MHGNNENLEPQKATAPRLKFPKKRTYPFEPKESTADRRMKLQTEQDDGSFRDEILYRRDNRFFTEQVEKVLAAMDTQQE